MMELSWRSKRTLVVVLASVSLLLPSATAWSTTTSPLLVHRPGIACPEIDVGSPFSRRYLPRSLSLLHAVQARAAEDIKELEGKPVEEDTAAFEASSLDTKEEDVQELTQKILNAIFLAVSFGWAAYTIFTIDAGMTRGWTQGEIAMRIPLDNWSNYESSLMEKPIFTKTLINVVIYLLGDWLSQTVFQKKNVLDFDVSRTLKNGLIGLCFGPLVHEYYAFSDHILPVEGGLMNRVQKIFMDQTIYLTVKCCIYICAVGLLSGDDWGTCKQTVKDKIGGIVVTAWKFWPLVHCITYGVIPARHRILWVNSVDLIWNAILATQAQKEQPEEETAAQTEAASDKVLAMATIETEDRPIAVTLPTPNELDCVGPTIKDIALKDSQSLVIDITDEGGEGLVVAEDEKRTTVATTSPPQADDKVSP